MALGICCVRLLFVLLTIAAARVAAEINWPFSSEGNGRLAFDLQIGTPPVSLKAFGLPEAGNSYGDWGGFWLADANVGGPYDHTKSSTFVQTAVLNDTDVPIGLIGTDTFVIGDQTKASKPFAVLNVSDFLPNSETAFFKFGQKKEEEPPFIVSLLNDETEKVLSFSYESIPDPSATSQVANGTLEIGGRQPSKCASDWVEFAQEPTSPFDWMVPLDEFSIGEYTFSYGAMVAFQVSRNFMLIPTFYFPIVVGLMGGIDHAYNATVRCTYSKDLVFTIGGIDYRVPAADLIDRSTEQPNGQCDFLGYPADCPDTLLDCYALPVSVLRNRCLLYRYDTPGIGIATALGS
ncbi:hypothetical protein M3Y99_01347500 [Aphelenchoides fujianensis]|nr:hypothetical protein M3Y99_01347500 [Aphelenchoides fujianensis]